MTSNMPPGYSDDGDAPEHGRDTEVYQALGKLIEAFDRWLKGHRHELYNDEMQAEADQIRERIDRLHNQLDEPL